MPTPSTGLVTPTLAELRDSIRLDVINAPALGPDKNTGPDSALGQLIDIVALLIFKNVEIQQNQYDGFDPDQASGVNLDSLSSITGVFREPARATTVVVEATGTPATLIPAATIVRIPSGLQFTTDADANIGGGGTVDIPCTSTVTGPFAAPIGSVTSIVTPVVGLDSVTNNVAGVIGRDIETDQQLRARRLESLQASGQATVPAIRAALLALLIVDQCVVLDNKGDVIDADLLPPHSLRAIVWPDPGVSPADDDIFITLFGTVPAGIEVDGARSGDVTDSQGIPQTMRYSIATEQVVFIDVTVTVDGSYPLDGDDQITDAVVDYGSTLSIGDALRIVQIICAAASVAGVLTVVALAKVGGAPGPADDVDIPAASTEVLTIDAVDVVVNS